MQDLNDKITGDTLTAAEFVEIPSELQNVIEALGQTLTSGDLNQLGKAIAGYVANSMFYTESGIADAYVLTVIGSKQRAPAYTNGFEISFLAGNTNTGASTINVAGLGVKNLKTVGGGNPQAGYITDSELTKARYDGTDFILCNPLSKFILPFSTLAAALDATTISVGQEVSLIERTTGNGGGAIWDAVPPGTFTVGAAIFDVFDHGTLPLQLKLRVVDDVLPAQFGVIYDANFRNGSDGKYYSDVGLTVLATNNQLPMQAAWDFAYFNVTRVRDGLGTSVKVETIVSPPASVTEPRGDTFKVKSAGAGNVFVTTLPVLACKYVNDRGINAPVIHIQDRKGFVNTGGQFDISGIRFESDNQPEEVVKFDQIGEFSKFHNFEILQFGEGNGLVVDYFLKGSIEFGNILNRDAFVSADGLSPRFGTGLLVRAGHFFGNHDGANNAAVLTDATASFAPGGLVGSLIDNITDGSNGTITANTATTITVTLSGGTDDDWDTGDLYNVKSGGGIPSVLKITCRGFNDSAIFGENGTANSNMSGLYVRQLESSFVGNGITLKPFILKPTLSNCYFEGIERIHIIDDGTASDIHSGHHFFNPESPGGVTYYKSTSDTKGNNFHHNNLETNTQGDVLIDMAFDERKSAKHNKLEYAGTTKTGLTAIIIRGIFPKIDLSSNAFSPRGAWLGFTKIGTHTGANNAAVLTDAAATFIPDVLIGVVITNTTDGSSGTITANTVNTITVTLTGGTDDDWDTGDVYNFDASNTVGKHTGANNASTLIDSTANFNPTGLLGMTITNKTDGSSGLITFASTTTIIASLAGGTDNDWDTNDAYSIADNTAKIRDLSTGGVTTGYDEMENGPDFSGPLIHGGFTYVTGQTVLTQDNVSGNTLTLPDKGNYFVFTPTVAVSINAIIGKNNNNQPIYFECTNTNVTFTNTPASQSMKLDGGVSYTGIGAIQIMVRRIAGSYFSKENYRMSEV